MHVTFDLAEISPGRRSATARMIALTAWVRSCAFLVRAGVAATTSPCWVPQSNSDMEGREFRFEVCLRDHLAEWRPSDSEEDPETANEEEDEANERLFNLTDLHMDSQRSWSQQLWCFFVCLFCEQL